jgi:hypothetical protein
MKRILTIFENSADAIDLLTAKLNHLGLKMERSFDLSFHEEENIACNCPHHGTNECDCQIVVLLIYVNVNGPDTVIAHSRDGRTTFSLVTRPDEPQQIDLINIFQNAENAVDLPR